MKTTREFFKPRRRPGLAARLATVFRYILGLPFDLIGKLAKRAVQVLLALFIIVLHPQFKWLWKLLTQSSLVQNYLKPSIRAFAVNYYEPYFDHLRGLPPYWATFSIALPLAVLEPAKLYATILIAERPKMGILLWLCLQGLSLILIDKTWSAVRPQSRKIWLVSRLHAWGWLNVSYGKHWIKSSSTYQTLMRWKEQARSIALDFFSRHALRRRRGA
jgi:hypothetical protein